MTRARLAEHTSGPRVYLIEKGRQASDMIIA